MTPGFDSMFEVRKIFKADSLPQLHQYQGSLTARLAKEHDPQTGLAIKEHVCPKCTFKYRFSQLGDSITVTLLDSVMPILKQPHDEQFDNLPKLLEIVPSDRTLYAYTFTVSSTNNTFRWGFDCLRRIIGNDDLLHLFYDGYQPYRKGQPADIYCWNRLSTQAQIRFLQTWLKRKIMLTSLRFIGFIEVSSGLAVHAHCVCWHPCFKDFNPRWVGELVSITSGVNPGFRLKTQKDVANEVTDRDKWLAYISKDYPVSVPFGFI